MTLEETIQDNRNRILHSLLVMTISPFDASQQLKAVASSIFGAQRSGTTTYSTIDEIFSMENFLLRTDFPTEYHADAVVQYLCTLLHNHRILTNESPQQIGARLRDVMAVEKKIRDAYNRTIGNRGMTENARTHISGIYSSGYKALFGRDITQNESSLSIESIGQSNTSPTSAQDNYVKVYFGGKTFEQNTGAIQREIPKYAGGRASEELSVRGKTIKRFRIIMSTDEYLAMQDTILGSAVQAVEVTQAHKIDRTTIDSFKMCIEQRGANLLIYNAGQLQVLSRQQVWAVGRALNDKPGAISKPPRRYF